MDCRECNGTGWAETYGKCLACDGRGSIVIEIERPITTIEKEPTGYLSQSKRDEIAEMGKKIDIQVTFKDRPDINGGTTLIEFADCQFPAKDYLRAVLMLKRFEAELADHSKTMIV
jgi:RecJ-like exonuclease